MTARDLWTHMAIGRDPGRGQSLVEFALTLPLLFAATVGLAEGGYYVAATAIVNHATQEGVRLGILESTASRDDIRTRIQERAAPIAQLDGSTITLELNGSSCDDPCYQSRATGDRLAVLTTYAHTPLVGYIFDGVVIPSNARSELWVE